jgi:hypothetical protein
VLKRQLRFRFGNKNCASLTFSLQNGIQKIPGREGEKEVIIEGQLRRNDWETDDGQKHSKHFVKAESWQFTQAKAKAPQKAQDNE